VPPYRRKIPFLALAPALVACVGLVAAAGLGALGVHELRRQSDEAAALRSELLAVTLAERLRTAGVARRAPLIERAARRSGAEILLVAEDGSLRVDGSMHAPTRADILELIAGGSGHFTSSLGRARYHVERLQTPLARLYVVALVRAPETPFATGSMVTSVAALAAMLIGVAALVAFAQARDAHADVTFVRHRIEEMAREAQPGGRPVPVLSLDQVGKLTDAFNALHERFAAAERVYRQDLAGVEAYDRDRSAFLAALSHELRTPLNAILGFTDVLLSEVDGPISAEAEENLGLVRTSGEHLRALIDDILDLSALESGELTLSRRMVDLYPIAEDVVREARVTAAMKALRIELEGDHALAYADPRRVRQILGNVVGNGVKFTPEGRVLVRVEAARRGARIFVTDTGPGIAHEEQETIFEEYRQSGELSAQLGGTGLGLAITRRLVHMHGGDILLFSELGHGATFIITLPREPGPVRPSRPRSELTSAASASRRPVSV
jgi:signal transduction histidine kinase